MGSGNPEHPLGFTGSQVRSKGEIQEKTYETQDCHPRDQTAALLVKFISDQLKSCIQGGKPSTSNVVKVSSMLSNWKTMSKMSRRPDPVNIIQDFTTSTFEGYRDPMESFSYVSDEPYRHNGK